MNEEEPRSDDEARLPSVQGETRDQADADDRETGGKADADDRETRDRADDEREGAAEPRVRRILVALDASAHSMAALEAAVQLAAELRAELTGLFVEDSNLLKMADLPGTREVGSYSAVSRSIDRPTLECQLRTLRAVAHRALAEAATNARVPYSFRVERGSVRVEVLKAASEVDLVTLGHLGWSAFGRRGVGSTARHMIGRGAGLVLVARRGFRLGSPVHAVYDGSPAARRGLALGARLAMAMDAELTVLVPGDRSVTIDDMAGATARLAAEAAVLLRGCRQEVNFRAIPSDEASAIADLGREHQAGAVVVPVGGDWLTPDDIQQIAATVSCPVLIVRSGPTQTGTSPAVDAPSAA